MRLVACIATAILFTFGCLALSAQSVHTSRSIDTSVSQVSDADSLKYAALDRKLDEYCLSLRFEPVKVQIGECDFLIETCSDSLVRQHVAVSLYEKYRTSKVMGVETVAIHILDKWFFSGKVRFKSQIELLDARIFADFNRQSLVGNKAPEITLYTSAGSPVTLFGASGGSKSFKVLYFYDAHCSKCRVETILLRNLFENNDYPVDFYAVYTGDDVQTWNDYVGNKFEMSPVSARVTHLWDPECDSDFQHKYGVIQTPRLFLIAPDNTIIGRSLDAKSLTIMLDSSFEEKTLTYGSDEAIKMLDGVLGRKDLTKEEVMYFADNIARELLSRGDTLAFRQMSGDLLYYLASKSGEASREGVDYLIDNYILPRSDVWKSGDDSLKIIGMASMLDDLLQKARPGSKISRLKVPAERHTWKSSRKKDFCLNRLGGKRNILIFYTNGCANCDAQKKAALDFLGLGASGRRPASDLMPKDASSSENIKELKALDKAIRHEARNTVVLMIDVDEIVSKDSHLSSKLFESFDLTTLPFVIFTDKHGTILRRYVSLL